MSAADVAEVQAAVRANRVWYHTLDLGHGVVTPGWFDHRTVVDRLPWPEVAGKRCLDVGTYDGFFAFELERRGAAEVVAVDIESHEGWDWPPDVRASGGEDLAQFVGPEKGAGFRVAQQALGSAVERRLVSAYDLAPDVVGTFDVVVCGTLLLHLRDPLRALEAIRTVCRGQFLSAEQIDLGLTALHLRHPVAKLNGSGPLCQWWEANLAGHRRMLFAAGFAIEAATRPYCVPFGVAHPKLPLNLANARQQVLQRLLAGGWGVPHGAALARPRV